MRIPKSRNLIFAKQVDQESVAALMQDIIAINDDDAQLVAQCQPYGQTYTPPPIKIYLDSYGGNAYQCLGLVGVIENSKTPVHVIVTGCAMSAGFFVTLAGHKRVAYRHATLLYHQVRGGNYGEVKKQEEDLQESKRLQQVIEDLTLRRTKIKAKQLKRVYDHKEEWFFTVEEALKFGVIDEVI